MSFLPTLLNPLYAGLAGLVSVPIIIHLLNKRKYKVVRWAAMDFLLDANRKNRRRVRIEHLIVLILRCLAVAFIALAIARPVVTEGGGLLSFAGAANPVERVIIVDDSASMRLRVGQDIVFDAARDDVRKLIEEVSRDRPSDRLTIALASRARTPELLAAHAASPRALELTKTMDGWEPVDLPLRLAAALEGVRAALLDAESGAGEAPADGEAGDGAADDADEMPSVQRIIYVATDLRHVDWIGEDGDEGRAIKAALEALGAKALVVLDAATDPAAAKAPNVGIIDLSSRDTHVTVGVPAQLDARIHNFGTSTARGLRLEVRAGERRLPARPIEAIPAGETKVITVTAEFTTAAPVAIEARVVEGDRLSADDRRAIALDVRDAVRVLVVDGTPDGDPAAGEALIYLFTALDPPGEARSGIAPVFCRPEMLRDLDLSEFDVVLTSDLPAWPAGQVPAIEAFVRRGGGLLMLGGPNVDAKSWRRDLWKEGAGLLPRPVTGIHDVAAALAGGGGASDQRFIRLRPPSSTDHPALRVFGGSENPFLDRVRAYRFLTVGPDAEGAAVPDGGDGATGDGGRDDPGPLPASVILVLEDADSSPILLERPFGAGRVALLTLSATRRFTNWPREPSFPVFLWELVKHVAPSATSRRNLAVGERLSWPIDAARFEPRALVRGPDPEAPPRDVGAGPRKDDPDDSLWIETPPITAAGVTTIELSPRRSEAATVLPFAFVLDPREGDLRRAEGERLESALEEVELRLAGSGEGVKLLEVTEGGRTELWRTLVILVGGFMLAESLLARRAAHHATEKAA